MGFTPFLEFSCPNLLLVFLNLLFLGTCNIYFRKNVGTFFGSFFVLFLLRAFSELLICMLHQFGLGCIKNGAL